MSQPARKIRKRRRDRTSQTSLTPSSMADFTELSFPSTTSTSSSPFSNPSSSPFTFNFSTSSAFALPSAASGAASVCLGTVSSSSVICGSTSSSTATSVNGGSTSSSTTLSVICGTASSSAAPSVSCASVSSSIARSFSLGTTPSSAPPVISGSTSSPIARSFSSGSTSSPIARSFSFGSTSFSASSTPFIRFGSSTASSSCSLSVRFGSSAATSPVANISGTTATNSTAITTTSKPYAAGELWTSVSLAAPFASPVTNHAASSQLAATSTASATSTGFTLNSTVPAASSSTGTSTTTAAKTAVAATATVESLPSLNHTLHNFVRRSLAPSRTRHRVRGRGKQSNVRRGSHNMQRVPQQQSLQQVLDNEAYKFGNQFVHQRYGKRPQEEEDATIKISQHQSSTVLSSIPENINRRVGEWIEPKEVILPADVFKRINGPAECKGERYAPQWDVNPNESLDYDFPEQGGTLGHRMLKGMILPRDCPSRVSKLIFANTSHQLAQFCGSYLEVAELGLHYQRHNAWLSDELLDVTNRLKDAEQEAASAKTAINAAIVSKEAAEKHLAEAKQAWNLEKSSLESNIIDLKKQLLAMKEEKDGAEKEALKL
ncbi:uncharacterized protein [Spinacia oleracea]|uniref:Uncharacterized protein isoform X2 n=1 Tax=Spinacia oleracea TaxID=3562 RepID=A0A9R0J7G2_SPIOL|nr:uncharacterized protein LOC110800332 isoform X2 [Spinacia oleracea]